MSIRHLQSDSVAVTVLEERARALAEKAIVEDRSAGEEMLSFALGDGRYSLPARFVGEVLPLGKFTPLSSAPAFVVGLVNVHGRLIAALDLRPLLDVPHAPPSESAHLLLVAVNDTEVGLIADEVTEVARAEADLAPTPAAIAGRSVAWVHGVDRHMNVVIDPQQLLQDPRLIVHDEAE